MTSFPPWQTYTVSRRGMGSIAVTSPSIAEQRTARFPETAHGVVPCVKHPGVAELDAQMLARTDKQPRPETEPEAATPLHVREPINSCKLLPSAMRSWYPSVIGIEL